MPGENGGRVAGGRALNVLSTPRPSRVFGMVPDRGTRVVDLAAWRRLRRAPAGGGWWGGRRMWTWDTAEQSRVRWPA